MSDPTTIPRMWATYSPPTLTQDGGMTQYGRLPFLRIVALTKAMFYHTVRTVEILLCNFSYSLHINGVYWHLKSWYILILQWIDQIEIQWNYILWPGWTITAQLSHKNVVCFFSNWNGPFEGEFVVKIPKGDL